MSVNAQWRLDPTILQDALTIPTALKYNGQAVSAQLDRTKLPPNLRSKIKVTYTKNGETATETAPKTVGQYKVHVGDGIEMLDVGTLEISPKPITITGVTATSREKNSSEKVELTGGVLQELVVGDDVSFQLGEGTIEPNKAGQLPVKTNITLTGADEENYKLTQPTNITVLITERPTQNHRVTFDHDDNGTLDGKTSVLIKQGEKLKDIPTPVANDGFEFSHWEKAGVKVNDLKNETITGAVTYTAIFKPIATKYKVMFKTDGNGEIVGASELEVTAGEKISSVPKVLPNSGYIFSRWENVDGKVVNLTDETITEDAIYKAIFRKVNELVQTKPLHRLYNPNTSEHFYTLHENERNHLVKQGWQSEGIAGNQPEQGETVYRLYNPNAGDHHYTMSAGERDYLTSVGWMSEGTAFYSGGDVAVHRLYNPNTETGNHHYTPSEVEKNHLVGLGWQDEEFGWYSY